MANAVAQNVAVAQNEPPTAAEQLITLGVNMRQRGNDADALRLFQQANQITPTPRALGQIALAEQALGRWIDAELHLRLTLREASDAWVIRTRATLEQAYREIATHVAELRVEGPAGADLLINGDTVAVLPSESLRTLAGECTLEIRAAGFASEVRHVTLPGGELTHMMVELRPVMVSASGEPRERDASDAVPTQAHALPRSELNWQPIAGWTGIGLGVASVVFGAVMTAQAYSNADTLNGRLCQMPIANLVAPEQTCPGAQSGLDQGQSLQWVGYGLGAVFIGVGTAFLLTSGSETEPADAQPLACNIGVGSIACQAHF